MNIRNSVTTSKSVGFIQLPVKLLVKLPGKKLLNKSAPSNTYVSEAVGKISALMKILWRILMTTNKKLLILIIDLNTAAM